MCWVFPGWLVVEARLITKPPTLTGRTACSNNGACGYTANSPRPCSLSSGLARRIYCQNAMPNRHGSSIFMTCQKLPKVEEMKPTICLFETFGENSVFQKETAAVLSNSCKLQLANLRCGAQSGETDFFANLIGDGVSRAYSP